METDTSPGPRLRPSAAPALSPVPAAIAAPYSPTTAPLRRLVDRFVLLVCHAHARGEAPAPELLAVLPGIPEAMRTAAGRAGDLEKRGRELVQTAAPRATPARVEVQLVDPPVTAWVPTTAEVGTVIRVRLASVDAASRRAEFEAVQR